MHIGQLVERQHVRLSRRCVIYKSQVGRIEYGIANGSPPLEHFFKRSCVACWRNDPGMDPANQLHASA